MSTRTVNRASFLAILLAAACAAHAGPIDPPVGAIAPSMKTLTQVEPRTAIGDTTTPGNATSVYKITQSGSYYLTANMTVPSGKSGIVIEANDVTVDLNGFAITGQAGSVIGVLAQFGFKGVTVRNGTVTGMGNDGVQLNGDGSGSDLSVERIAARANGDDGVQVACGSVKDCKLTANGSYGLYSSDLADTTVEATAADNNADTGLYVLYGVVQRCTVNGNALGIYLSSGVVSDCEVSGNASGVEVSGGTVTRCSVHNSSGAGIKTGGGGLVKDNNISSASIGTGIGVLVQGGSGARVEGNNFLRLATGVVANSANNLIISNSLRQCTNAVSVAANNRLGPLVTGTASPAITGNSGGGLGVTDPFANIIY